MNMSGFRHQRRWSRLDRLRIALTAAIVLLLAVPAGAAAQTAEDGCRLIRGADTPDDPTDDVEVCELPTYFHRAVTPLGNLSATAADSVPSFDPEEPTSATPAAYAQVLGRLVSSGQSQNWPTFEGSFTGNVDTMRVKAFLTSEVYQSLLGSYPLIFELSIDGTPIVVYSPAAGDEQDVPMTPVDDGVSSIEFQIINLYRAMELNGLDLGPDVSHTVRLSMSALYYGDGNSIYYYDSVDRPSGIHFNAERIGAFTTYDALG